MGGNFAGSLVEGLAGGIQTGQKQAMALGLSDLQMQHLKTTNKAAELALKMEQEKERIFNLLPPEEQQAALFPKVDNLARNIKAMQDAGIMPKTTQEVPLPSYEPGMGMPPIRPGATMSVPQQIAQGQFGGGGLSLQSLDPGTGSVKLGPMKYSRTAEVSMPDGNPGTAPIREDGLIDISKAVAKPVKADMRAGVGAGKAPTQTPTNPYTQAPMGPTAETGPPPTMQVETPTAGGGKVKNVVPLFPGATGSKVTGTTSGGVRTELDLMDVPIPAAEVNKWTDGKGGSPAVGWTPRQAQGRGFSMSQDAMSSEAGGKAVMLTQAVDDMKTAIAMILPEGGGFNRKLALAAATNTPEDVVKGSQIVRSSILNAMSAKLRMETGAQSNETEIQGIVDRYWPSGVRDNEKSAKFKTGRLLDFMERGKFILDPKGRIVAVDPPPITKKPALGLGKGKDPATMTNDELLKALR